MSYEAIELKFDGAIARLTLNDPDALNAISGQMIKELNQAADEISDPANGARVVLWTGKGRGFCSGANLAGGGRWRNSGRSDNGGARGAPAIATRGS